MSPAHILLAISVVAIWGFNFAVMKLGLASLPPLIFSGLRFIFAALPLVFFLPRPCISWQLLVAFGTFQFSVQFALIFGGLNVGMPAGLASLVVQLQAFFTIALAAWLLHEKVTSLQIAGCVVGSAGIVLVAAKLGGDATLAGFLMVVGGGASWACANMLSKRMQGVDTLALVTWASLVAAPELLLLSLLVDGPSALVTAVTHSDWRAWGAILFQSYPNTIFGFAIWSMLMRRYPAATVAPFGLLIPVAGMLSGALVLGESLSWWKICAAGLVLVGLAMTQIHPRSSA